jgi:regulator of cell morphogenesis and NO signaling
MCKENSIPGGIMTIDPKNTVGNLAVAVAGATRVFEALGIDYCCGGKRLLDEACRIANLEPEAVVRSLAQAEAEALADKQTPDWQQATLASLLAHIVETHHVFTRNELQRLDALMNKVCAVHGQTHAELAKLQALFHSLQEDLIPHMLKEEQALFPYVEQLESAMLHKAGISQPFFGTVQNPVRIDDA